MFGEVRPKREPPLRHYTKQVRKGAAPLVQLPGLSGGAIVRSPYNALNELDSHGDEVQQQCITQHPERLKGKRDNATSIQLDASQSLVLPSRDGNLDRPKISEPRKGKTPTPRLVANPTTRRALLPMPTRAGGFSRIGVRSDHMNKRRHDGKGFLETSVMNKDAEMHLQAKVQQSRFGATPPLVAQMPGEAAMMSDTLSKIPRDATLFAREGTIPKVISAQQLISHPGRRVLDAEGLPQLGSALGGRSPPPTQLPDPMTLTMLGRTEFFERTHAVDGWNDNTLRTIHEVRQRKAQRAQERRQRVNAQAVERVRVREQQRPYSVIKEADPRPHKRQAIEHVMMKRLVSKLKQNGAVNTTDRKFFHVVRAGMSTGERRDVSKFCKKEEDFNQLREVVQGTQQELEDEEDAMYSGMHNDIDSDSDDAEDCGTLGVKPSTPALVVPPSDLAGLSPAKRPGSEEQGDERFVRERVARQQDAARLPHQFRREPTSELRRRTLTLRDRTHHRHKQQLALGMTHSAYHQQQNQGQQNQHNAKAAPSMFNTLAASNLELSIQQKLLQKKRGPRTIGIDDDSAEYNELFSRHEVDALCTIFARAQPTE